MKFYVPNSNALIRAFLQVFGFSPDQTEVSSLEEADVCLVTDSSDLRGSYRPDRFFGFIATRDFDLEKTKSQPENVFVMDGGNLIHNEESGAGAFKYAFEKWQASKAPKAKVSTFMPAPQGVVALSRQYTVLIVDDSVENQMLALQRLVGQKMIITNGPEEALRYLNLGGKMPDAVLTDMQMRPDKAYGALNLDQYGVTETIHSGFAVMLEATQRGIPVAIVTDGNHHLDWVSAMFDHIKDATVNGQPVKFFNNIGKRWDEALKALMEPN